MRATSRPQRLWVTLAAQPPHQHALYHPHLNCSSRCFRPTPAHPQKLWATLAANRLNIVPSLNFLIDRGLKEDAAGADASAVAATGKEVGYSYSRHSGKLGMLSMV